MPKRRLRKAKALIKRWNDSWGSLEHKFKERQLNKRRVIEERRAYEDSRR